MRFLIRSCTARVPSVHWYVIAACHTFFFGNVLFAWGKLEEDRPRAVHERIMRYRAQRQSSRRPPPNTRSE